MKYIWVIEMLCRKGWEPTIGCGLTKSDAIMRMRAEWGKNNPSEKFRIIKYNSSLELPNEGRAKSETSA